MSEYLMNQNLVLTEVNSWVQCAAGIPQPLKLVIISLGIRRAVVAWLPITTRESIVSPVGLGSELLSPLYGREEEPLCSCIELFLRFLIDLGRVGPVGVLLLN